MAKLSQSDVEEIIRCYKRGVKARALARRFKVDAKTIMKKVNPEQYDLTKAYSSSNVEPREPRIDMSKATVITDYPDTLTGWLMGDPTKSRLKMVHGDDFEVQK